STNKRSHDFPSRVDNVGLSTRPRKIGSRLWREDLKALTLERRLPRVNGILEFREAFPGGLGKIAVRARRVARFLGELHRRNVARGVTSSSRSAILRLWKRSCSRRFPSW